MELIPNSKHETLFQLVAGPLLHEVQTAFGHEKKADYLLASNLRRQVWHFWLHACGPELAQDAATHLIYAKSKSLVAEALNSLGMDGACPGMLNALGKLGQFALAKETYQNLGDILVEGGRGSKFIRHQEVLTSELIDRLHLLPDMLRRAEIVVGEDVKSEDIEKIAFILKRRPDLVSHLDHACGGDAESVLSMLFDQARNGPENERLPIVWQGNTTIKPVLSRNELKRLATEMNNCLERYWEELYTGSKALFVLVGEAPVAICFTKLAGLGWELEQVRGLGNRWPTWSEYQRIRQGFLSRPDFFIPREHLICRLLSQSEYAVGERLR